MMINEKGLDKHKFSSKEMHRDEGNSNSSLNYLTLKIAERSCSNNKESAA